MERHFSDSYHRPYFMGISILVIFMMHLGYSLNYYVGLDSGVIYNFFGHGDFGVDVFFFLSTYGLSISLHQHTLKRFYWNRFLRIVPTYLVFLLICLTLFVTRDVVEILKYVGSSLSGLACMKDFPYSLEWYLPSLILVYAFFPLIDKVGKGMTKLHVGVIALILIGAHIALYALHRGICEMFAMRLPIILLGSIVYHLEKEEGNRHIQLLALLALYGVLMFQGNEFRVTLAIPAVLYLAGKAERLPLHGAIAFCGRYSLEIYLSQFLATTYFMDYYKGDVRLEVVMVVGIVVVLSAVLAMVGKVARR